MFGKVTGGRKFKAFIYIFTANCVCFFAMIIVSIIALFMGKEFVPLYPAEWFVKMSFFCGGFYAGANVLKAGVELAINKMGEKE